MRPTRGRRLLFAVLLLLLLAAAIEALSATAYRVALGAWPDRGDDRGRRRALLAEGAVAAAAGSQETAPPPIRVPGSMSEERLHPYLGFVHAFPSDSGAFLNATPYGFYRRRIDPEAPADAYRIGVVGGSAAFLFSFKGRDRLIERLADAPLVGGRAIEIVSLALGGYKQPQQLMTVAWLLGEGERFDLIVNLDGFNEVAFGAENARRGVHPSFPRNWWLRAGGRDSLADLEALGRAAVAVSARRDLARSFDGAAGATVTGNLIWRLLDRAAAARVQQAEAAVAEATRDDLGYAETGPPFAADGDAALFAAIAARWRDSSIHLDRLCRASRIRYVHGLQPNQYLAGSKPMGTEERAIAIAPDHPRREAVEKGYPVLRAEGPALRAAGVDFHDLTQIYASVRAVVYDDACCHVNNLGNELIADALAAALLVGDGPGP